MEKVNLYLRGTGDVAKHLEKSWISFFRKHVKEGPLRLQYLAM